MPSTITEPVATRLPNTTVERLREIADGQGVTLSAALAAIVRDSIKQRPTAA